MNPEASLLVLKAHIQSSVDQLDPLYNYGSPRLQTYSWRSCKLAHVREQGLEGQRPKLGRKPATTSVPESPKKSGTSAKGETRSKIHPNYVKLGPLITEEMLNEWPQEHLGLHPSSATSSPPSTSSPPVSSRPVRSSRNPAPRYVDVLTAG